MGPVSVICHTQVSGQYKIVVRGPDNDIRQETPWFDNLITNNGMNQIAVGNGSTPDLCTQCYIGRSGTTPAITDTQLGSLVNPASSVSVATYNLADGLEPYWRAYKIFTFDAGVATGDIREVGCGYSPTDLFSRSLIQGVMEVPTTITVLADEKLEVYYERHNYINIIDQAGSFVMAGTTVTPYTTTTRPSNIDVPPDLFKGHKNNDGIALQLFQQKFLGTIYDPISGVAAVSESLSAATYVTNSHYLDYTFQFAAGVANFSGGIGTAMFFNNQSRFQILFNPYIIKTDKERLRINIRLSWSRYVPAL